MPGSVGKKIGCAGCGCVLAIFGFIGAILYITVFSNVAAKWMGQETYPITGDAHRFDPVAAIPEIRKRVGEKAVLIDMRANYVNSDGTLDLLASYRPAPYVDYTFRLPLDKAPSDAPPVGAGRSPGDIWIQDVRVKVYEPGQSRHVRRVSGNSSSEYTYRNEGMDLSRGTPQMGDLKDAVDSIKLTTQEMWKVALAKGADQNAVAIIEADDSGTALTISSLKIYLYWDRDGKLDENRSHTPTDP